ncbi:MAG: hypothetical protein K2X29_10960 [Candidatus Obscuribacterales bacterium]|nr:hypothetical protein [Candidatus Obscuribacterales bacterium]
MSFIFTEEEYKGAKVQFSKAEEFLKDPTVKGTSTETLLKKGLEDIAIYENLKAGIFPESYSIGNIGRLLTCVRIAAGITREELAQCLGEDVKVVARNERHEYHGTTLLYAQRVLFALGAKVTVTATLS